MKKLLLALALLWPTGAWAQCNGVFPANTLCGNLSGSPAPPAAFSSAGTIAGPASSTSGHIPTYGNSLGTSLFDQQTISTSQGFNFTGVTSFTSAANFSSVTSLNGITNFTSQFQVNGIRIQFPVGPDTVGGLGTAQTWTASNTFATTQTSIQNLAIGQVSVTSPFSVGNGGTGVATIPAHSLIIGEGTAATSNTTAGTLGQCATSNGGTADPTFASGCWTLLSSTTATSGAANITDTTHITANYNDYELSIANCAPVTTGVTLILQDNVAAGLATSNYLGSTVTITTAGTVTASTSTSSIPLNNPAAPLNNAAIGWGGTLRLTPPTANGQRRWTGEGNYDNGATVVLSMPTGYLSTSVALTGFQLQFTGGNIATCTAKLYGKL